jgi:uncharacterized protein (TIGR02246 family)
MAATSTDSARQEAADPLAAVKDLHRALLEAWNRRDAAAMAALCSDDCAMVGFDGSQMNGRQEIEAVLRPIFADHPTAAYVFIVRRVWMLGADAAALTAVAGMVPPGKHRVMPERHAVQSLAAARRQGHWQVALFQNTPATFDGRPALRDALTRELDAALERSR